MSPQEKLIAAWREMYELTEPECAGSCRGPRTCCSPEYCDLAEEYAWARWQVAPEHTLHPRLKFMGSAGCTLQPHLRPLCTLHTCAIGSVGSSGDSQWDRRYFDLRERIDELEASLCDLTG